jgi:2-methylcitrate dehydratase
MWEENMDQTTEMLSAYACELTYDDLPPEVVHQVKRTLIDTLGCALGGFRAEPAVIARRLAQSVTSTIPARILGTTATSAPDLAGFANGVMVRYLDYNDSYFSPGGGHPSDMIPAVLALADPLGRDGRTVITATVLAYEVFGSLSDQVVTGNLGWDQGMFSVIGAVCAAGKVMGLDQQAMQHAISLAVVPNLPLGVTRVGELSMWKGCAAACATRAGIFAAQLAQQGMTGPAAPLEGRRGLWQQAVGKPVHLARLGGKDEPCRITSTIFKSFPSQIHTQGPISLALELHSQVDASDIAAIRMRGYRSAVHSAATEPEKWAPQTRETADHSIPYLVAVAFHDGAITPASFTSARLQDPAVHRLMAKMTIEEDIDFTQRFPAEYNCHMEVTTTSGQRYTAALTHPPGHWRNPLSDTGVADKFRRLAADVLPAERYDRTLELLWSLEQFPNLTALFDSLVV